MYVPSGDEACISRGVYLEVGLDIYPARMKDANLDIYPDVYPNAMKYVYLCVYLDVCEMSTDAYHTTTRCP